MRDTEIQLQKWGVGDRGDQRAETVEGESLGRAKAISPGCWMRSESISGLS